MMNMNGIDTKVSINSIIMEVPRICDPGTLDFFNNGYSRPNCVNVVTSKTKL